MPDYLWQRLCAYGCSRPLARTKLDRFSHWNRIHKCFPLLNLYCPACIAWYLTYSCSDWLSLLRRSAVNFGNDHLKNILPVSGDELGSTMFEPVFSYHKGIFIATFAILFDQAFWLYQSLFSLLVLSWHSNLSSDDTPFSRPSIQLLVWWLDMVYWIYC